MSPDIEINNADNAKQIELHVADLRKKYGMPVNGGGYEKVPRLDEAKKILVQPTGSGVFSDLSQANSKYFSTKHQIGNNTANIDKIHRDQDKISGSVEKIKFKRVETPGVIPRTLTEVESILKRVNEEEQPRVEKILDSAHGNLDESQKLLQKINTVMGDSDTSGLLHALKKYDLLFKIGLGLAGFSILAAIVLLPWVLLRIIIFGL